MKSPIPPPPLSIVENEVTIVNPSVTEIPQAPIENIRAITKEPEFAATRDNDGDWFLVMLDSGTYRHLTESEARRVASTMNEQGSNVITLYCRNDKCKHKNSWIKRSSDDVKKNIFFCDSCKQALVR